jgi:parafibromin
MSNFAATLQEWATAGKLKEASLNAEDTTLTLGDVKLPGGEKATVSFGGKSCEYTLASLFLQILDPDQSLVKYRSACKKHKVADYVKATDKAAVVAFFLGEAAVAAPPEQAPPVAPPPPKDDRKEKERPRESSSSSHKHHHKKDRDRDRDRDRHRRDKHHHKAPPAKKQRKAIDNEKLFSNLITVVDKRSKKAQMENDQLVQALSCEGFGVTPEVLAQYKEQSQIIASNEIPVGNSASILKAAAGKDLSRILKLYMDTLHPPKSSKSSASSSGNNAQSGGTKKTWRAHLVGQKPVIIVPKGMTAPITLINAHEFFANSKFVPRDEMTKKGVTARNVPTTFSRRVGQRMGGGLMEYELMDNPKVKLRTAKDWERVVAVLAFGASWQFKDWPAHYSHPVRLFGSVFGFYVGMEGAKVPQELQGWSVVQQKLNRDKRGLDSVTYASFWNGLEEWMALHKSELLPQQET